MLSDFSYIIKRIIIGVGIALSLMYIRGNVFAAINNTPFENLTIPSSSSSARFFDVNGANSFTNKGYSFLNYAGISYALPSTPNYTYGTYGGLLSICDLGLVNQNYFKFTVVFVSNDGNDYISPNYSGLNSRLGVGNSVSSPTTWFNATSISQGRDSVYLPGILPIGDYVQTTTFVFKSDGTASCLYFGYSSANRTLSSSDVALVGYQIENMGATQLSATEITNIINNSNQQVINNINTQAQNIVANQNSNTNAIINNQDSNTQDIINNQNQNTQDMIDSQKSCTTIDKNNIITDNKFLDSSGYNVQSNNYGITDFISTNGASFKILQRPTAVSGVSSCFYDMNKSIISCINNNSLEVGTYLTIPDNVYYIRFSIWKSQNVPVIEYCKNGNQAINDTMNDIKDMDIDDSSKESPDDSDFQDYQDKEQDLFDYTDDIDTDDIDIALDPDSSNWIWTTLTNLIQSNQIVFNMFIAILSTGVIKLALGR